MSDSAHLIGAFIAIGTILVYIAAVYCYARWDGKL